MPVVGTARQRTATVAAVQRGRVSRGQLLAAGLSSSAIDRLTGNGHLLAEHRGVYAVGHRAEIPGAAETAALLAVRAGAVLSHVTALRWWGVSRGRNPSINSPSPIHVTVPGNGGGVPDGVVVHRSTILTARDVRVRAGLPVTAPARTLLDLAPELFDRDLERAFDEALVQRILRRHEIDELLERAGRHSGRARLAALVRAHTTPTFTRSEAEERFLALIRSAGLPLPLVNVRRHGFEIDFLWPDAGFAVEIDGFAFHGSRSAFERDRRRDRALRDVGVIVGRVTWAELTAEPMAVIAHVAAQLATRRPSQNGPRGT